MASITIRNLDDNLKRKLRLRAAHRNRSMEDEARDIYERRSLRSPPRPEIWLTPFVNSLNRSEALNWNCRRAGRCKSRRISNDPLGHECAVGTFAADAIGQGVGMDAIAA